MKLHELATKVNELMADVIEGKLSPDTPVEVLNIETGGEIYIPQGVELETHYAGDDQEHILNHTVWIKVVDY